MEMGNNSANFKWIVYHVICTVNNKIYIGIHKTKTPYEFDKYIGGGWEVGTMIKHPSTAYENALKKYGYDKFIRTTIKVFDSEAEAKKLEAFLVDVEFIKRRDTYNTALGGNGSGKFKSFYQYDLNGNFIKEWKSRQELLDNYKFSNDVNKIHRAVVNHWIAYDSYWTIEKVEKLDLSVFKENKFSTIYQYDVSFNQIATFKNALEVSKALGASIDFVREAINKKIPIKGTFLTKNPNKIFDIIKKYQDNILKLNDKSISIYKNERIVKTFKSLLELSKYLSISIDKIKKSIFNSEEINGYLISYGYNDFYTANTKPGLKINQYDLKGNFIKQWPSLSECAKTHPKVRLVLAGHRKHNHGYTFKICTS